MPNGLPDGSVGGSTPPTMQKTCRFDSGLGRSLEEQQQTYSSILTWKNPTDKVAWWATI